MVRTTERKEDPVLRRIIGLASERRDKEEGLADHLAIKRATVSGWKYRGGSLYKKYIYEICDYLDTTPNYLFLGPEEEEDMLSPEEMKILRKYRRLSRSKKECVMDALKELAEKETKTSKKYVVEDEIVENPLY